MSAASKDALVQAVRSLRIIALPLTRKPLSFKNALQDTHPLIYYHFQTPPVQEAARKGAIAWMTRTVTNAWSNFGKAPEGSWKLKTFRYGERIMDRIEFEELALKGLDPSLGPKLTAPGSASQAVEEEKDSIKIPLVYPPSYTGTPLLHLQSLVAKRLPRHRRGAWTWLLVSPLTAPVAIIPIIPNLPFFFCIWRAWHHYRALKASQYLEALLERGAIVPEASKELDAIYAAYAPQDPSSAYSPGGSTPSDPVREAGASGEEGVEEALLLSRDAVPPILRAFEMAPTAATDIYRALAQADMRTRKRRGS